jgi:hypothetical protein
MNNQNTKILSELYSKCLNQENDIENEITKLINNKYPFNTIDRIKEKISEKIENFSTSIKNLSISIDITNISNNEKEIWKRKQENLFISKKNLSRRLEDYIFTIKKKYFQKNGNYKSYENEQFGKNINALQQENETLKTVIRISTDIENNASNINGELDSQIFSMRGINDKLSNIFGKLTTSHSQTGWLIKRGKGDTYLCIFLGIITILILYYTYYHLRPKIRGKKI